MSGMKEAKEYMLSKSSFTFDDLCLLVSILRSEEGCPWDREQTNKTIRNSIIDETYEFIEGLDCDDDKLMCEELGDVLFQIVFHADIKKDEITFNISDVIDGICKKMILRHPHVFGDINVNNSDEVLVNWENIKNNEKSRKTPYEQLDSVAKSLPSLMRAQKLISKAEKNELIEKKSFDNCFDDIFSVLSSLKESKGSEDLGKLMFSICNLAHTMDADAEQTLYIENDNFLNGFK